jgi:predicted AAA+ superfamily ATPase
MVNRIQKLSKNNNLFLFGARGTGKTTLIKSIFNQASLLWIDLLTAADEDRFGRNPDELSRHLKLNSYDFVVIDEIQKFPKLLDIVHKEIESKKHNKAKPFFILTGSSTRKLKRSGANLLGGRAFTYFLFPFTFKELGSNFNLDQVLKYGSLPIVLAQENDLDKDEFLRGYVRNYLKDEILEEQIVRQIESFKDFLEVASQMNGRIINYSKIAKDVGCSDQTVKSFYQVLEDTLLGIHLPPFHRSIRKRQREAAKFYLFDLGVKTALARQLKLPLIKGSVEYGNAFEQFIILEVYRYCEYAKNDFRMSYLRTKDDAEIDLIIERPGQPDLLLEIKSKQHIQAEDVATVSRFLKDWDRPCEAQLWSQDPISKEINGVQIYPWQEGFKKILK